MEFYIIESTNRNYFEGLMKEANQDGFEILKETFRITISASTDVTTFYIITVK